MAEPTKVHVPLGERAYDILIGPNLLEGAGERLKALFPGRRYGIVTDDEVAKAQLPRLTRSLDTIAGRARIKRTMWSRRAQEYEAKINSGDLVSIAEVVRDLHRSEAQPEQSYSERQLYEAALDRMVREIAAAHKVTEPEAHKMIEAQLAKSPKRTKAVEVEAEADSEEDGDEAEAA